MSADKNMKFCEYCGKEYEVCSLCEANGTFKYRLHYCSTTCFKNAMKGGTKVMKIQYNSLTYNLASYDFKKGVYTTSNGIKVKEKDVQIFMLTQDEFKKLKETFSPKKEEQEKE